MSPLTTSLSAAWQAVGPGQVASQSFGSITGRVTAVAIDPADATGNTVYLGTTGGGVWKSTNAAGAAASVTFAPLTDTLPVFAPSAGVAAIPSLSIGAVSAGAGVVLAGTGDPNDASDSYYGEGLLRSADGGATWTLIQGSKDGVAGNHSFVGLSVAGFAWSSTTPTLAVAALSQAVEGVIVNAEDATNSVMGLYYTTDAGVTWQMAKILDGSATVQTPLPSGGNNGGNAATAVVWNATRQLFYAAVRYHGYYSSADGVTWTRLVHQPGTGLTTAACPTNPNATGSTACPIFRGVLAVQAATGDTFALAVDSGNLDQGLWQDVCGLAGGSCGVSPIAFGTRLVSTPLEVGSGSTAIAQGDYDLALAAVGSSADTVLLVGTEDLYRCSLAAGCVLRNTTNAENGCAAPAMVAPAQHAIAVMAGTAPLVYVGNDGGIWRSTDGVAETGSACAATDASHFQNLNARLGSLAEVVSFAQHPTDPATVLVGLGASGTAGTGTAGSAAWPQVSAGEGGTVAIDPANSANWYVSEEAGVSLRYCARGSGCAAADFVGAPTIGYVQVSNDASLVDEPFVLDPVLASDVLIGTCRVWRGPAASGSSWPGSNAISKIFAGPLNAACSATTNPVVRSLGAGGPASGATAAQNAGSTVLYAGMAGGLDGGGVVAGHVFATYAGGSAGGSTVWTDLAASTVTNDTADAGKFNPGGFDVSSVVADAHDASGKTVYATVMGFSGNGVNAPHVYRSVDGGAHWTNISSNLPGAPANALAIDPNDANTVYVALDTGVYATSTVTTCAAANCWTSLGTGLPNAPVVGLAAAAGMATGDGRTGELRVATYGRGIWAIPLLTATGGPQPAMSLSPAALTFAAQQVATASVAQTIMVTNSGTAALTVSSIVPSGDFTETDTCVGASVAVGATCAVQVSFLPTAVGARTGVLTIFGNVSGGQATAALSGTGTTPAAVVLTPLTVNFSVVNVGATSAVQNITISNTGGVPVTLTSEAVTGDYKLAANTCGTSLGASVGCTVSIAFVPTASGTRTGTFTVVDGVGTQTASLTGVGVLPATDGLAPLSLSFAAQQLSTASTAQTVTLTNTGDAALALISATIASGDFTAVNACGTSLSGHASCAIQVAYVPKSVGAETGVLTVADVYRSQSVALSGIGVAPPGVTLSPLTGLAFAATAVGTGTTAQTATFTNNGGVVLAITSVKATGDFAIPASGSTCGSTLGPGAACTVQVVFAPSVGGPRTGLLTVVDNAAGSPHSLTLSGSGVDFTLGANGSTSVSVTAGGSAVFPLILSSAAGITGTVAMTCTGAPAHSTCLVVPSAPALGGTTLVSVTVQTNTAELVRPDLPGRGGREMWLACLLPLLLLRRRRRAVWGAVFCCLLLAGCAASRLIPLGGTTTTTTTTPTATGTYSLTVSGSSAGLTRSVGLTLVVQ